MNYTSIKQSKKLVELGLSPETADMFWLPVGDRTDKFTVEVNIQQKALNLDRAIPCWSVGALLGLMPKCIVVDGDNYFQYIAMGDTVSYCNVKDEKLVLFNYDFLLDSLFAMVVWLIENNYIKN